MQLIFIFIFLISTFLSLLSISYYIFNLSTKKKAHVISKNKRNINEITAVVPIYMEHPKIFERTICSLYNSHIKFIVVGDNALHPYDTITKKYGGLFIYKNKHCGKRNALANGAAMVTSKYILFVDSDTILCKNTAKRMLNTFKDGIGGVGAQIKMRIYNNKNIPYALEFFQRLKEFGFSKIESLGMPMVLDGECVMYRTNLVKKYMQSQEYIDGRVFGKNTAYADDRQLTAHILDLGYKAIRAEGAIAITEAPKSVKKVLNQAIRWSRAGYLYFFKELLDGTYLNRRPLFYSFQMTYMYILPILGALLIILRSSIYINRGINEIFLSISRTINIFNGSHTTYIFILILEVFSYIITIFYVYKLSRTIRSKKIRTFTLGGIYMAMLFFVSVYGFLTFWSEKWER